MKGILLIAWLILFPLADTIGDYFVAKRNKLFDHEDYSDDIRGVASLIGIIFYILMAIFIYQKL